VSSIIVQLLIETITSDSQFILDCEGSGGTKRDEINVTVVTVAATTVTLLWTAPSENMDGSKLDDLKGFIIYYGKESGEYTERLDIPFPDSDSYVITNLTHDRWYFVMTSYNSLNIESDYSDEVSKIIE
jgi:hypothetical protein